MTGKNDRPHQFRKVHPPSSEMLQPLPIGAGSAISFTAQQAEPIPERRFPIATCAEITSAKCLILKNRKPLNSNKNTLYRYAKISFLGIPIPDLPFPGGSMPR
jgi:hypothetical protein